MNGLDPKSLALLQAGSSMLAGSGPSRYPRQLGQVMGEAGQQGINAYLQARQANATEQLRAAQLAEIERKTKQAEQEAQYQALLRGALFGNLVPGANAPAGGAAPINGGLYPNPVGGLLSAPQAAPGGSLLDGPRGALYNPDVMERLGLYQVASGNQGGSGLMNTAAALRKRQEESAALAAMRSRPGVLGAGVTSNSPQGEALMSNMTGDTEFDNAVMQAQNQALNSNTRLPPQALQAPRPGAYSSLFSSPFVGDIARARQNELDSMTGGITPQQVYSDRTSLQQQHMTAKNQTPVRPFGGGATGGALEILTRDAAGYANGTLTPDQERTFQAAVSHYTQPAQYQDPDTGLMMTRRPELPPFVKDALNRRGAPVPMPVVKPRPGSDVDSQPPPAARPQRTAWGLARLTTGPVPAGAELLSRTPLVGDMMQAPQFTQARNFVPQLQRDLVRVLQNNPRYAEGERKAIESEISLEPRLFDNSTAYRDRLIGIDNALEVRERNAAATANSSRVGREERVQAMNIVNALRQFRQNLGVPPRVSNDADWEALESGTEYIAPDGKVKVKR